MPAFPRSELEEMIRRFVAANDKAGDTGDWEPLADVLRRGRDLLLEQRPEARVRGARPRRDPPLRVRHRDGRPREVDVPVRARADRRPGRRGDRRLAPGRAGDAQADGTPYEIAGTGGSWFRYGGNFQWVWQRDFFDHANAGAAFIAMAKDGKLSEGMQRRMSQGTKAPGWVQALRVRLVRDASRRSSAGVFMMRFDMRAPDGRRARRGALPRRPRDGGVGRGAWLPRARGVGAPRLARRLPAGAPRPRGGAGGAHAAPPDPGRGADPPAPRSRSSSQSRWRCSTSSPAGASPTCWRSATGKRSTRCSGATSRARGRRMDACLEALRRAWTGEPFEFEGRHGARAAATGDARRAAAPPRRREPGGGAPRGALRARHADPGRRSFPRRALPRGVRASRPRSGALHRSARRHRHLGLRRRGSSTRRGSASVPTCSTTRACTLPGWAAPPR